MVPPVESLGPDDGRPVLLIGGATWSRDWWDPIATDPLVAAGARVVRYDHRDTGEAEHWPPGAPGYTGADLVTDAVAVLDGLGIEAAHVIGLSMGGGIAQCLALAHRGRVTGLTLIATTAVDPRVTGLPGPDPAVFAPGPELDDPVETIVEGERPYAGPGRFEETRVRAIARRVVARSRDLAAGRANHPPPGGPSGPDDLGALAGLPTTVVHGSADPVFPLAHGHALAAAIPGAELVVVEGMGHQLPPERDWGPVVGKVLSRARR